MSTRAEQVEACRFFASSRHPRLTIRLDLDAAAATLTRDGEILEKLHALIARLSTGSDRSKEIAEELKAIVGDAR